jgi:hypothetical protein
MKQPQVRERDITLILLAVNTAAHKWLMCDVEVDEQEFEAFIDRSKQLTSILRLFHKQQFVD